MTQAEADRLRGIVRIRTPGCGEVAIDLRRIVEKALRHPRSRSLSEGERP